MTSKAFQDVPLKEYFESILIERDKAVNIALAAAKEAVGVSERNAEKWMANANEWRAAMSDKDKMYMTKAEFMAYKDAMERALQIEKDRKSTNVMQYIGWAVAILIAAATIIEKIFNT